MSANYEEALKEAFAVAPAGMVVYHTLEFNQPGVQGPVYIAQVVSPFEAKLESGETVTFEAVGFQFSLPPASEEGFQSLNIAVDNTSRRLREFLQTALSQPVPIQVKYRPYLSNDLTKPQMNPPLVLHLTDVEVSLTQVTARATFMDLVNLPFPCELYTRMRFPTLG